MMHVCSCPFVSVHTLNQVSLTSRQLESKEDEGERREVDGRKGLQERREEEEGGMDAWTEMPSISQGAKALEMAPSFRESKAKEREK